VSKKNLNNLELFSLPGLSTSMRGGGEKEKEVGGRGRGRGGGVIVSCWDSHPQIQNLDSVCAEEGKKRRK